MKSDDLTMEHRGYVADVLNAKGEWSLIVPKGGTVGVDGCVQYGSRNPWEFYQLVDKLIESGALPDRGAVKQVEERSEPPPGWKVRSYAPGLWQVDAPDGVMTWREETRENAVAACWRVRDAVFGAEPDAIDSTRRVAAAGVEAFRSWYVQHPLRGTEEDEFTDLADEYADRLRDGKEDAAIDVVARERAPYVQVLVPRGLHLEWNGTEWVDDRCGCRYHPDDDRGSHGGAPHVHRCERHSAADPEARRIVELEGLLKRERVGKERAVESLRAQRDACVCPFAVAVDGKISAEERASTYHVWKYLAENLAAHLIAVVGLDVVVRAHGCGEGSDRDEWLAKRVRQAEPYANTEWATQHAGVLAALEGMLAEDQARIDKGKGTWPQPDYVTDESWARLHGHADALRSALRTIRERTGAARALERLREMAAVDATLRARMMYAQGWAEAIGQDVAVAAFTPAVFKSVISELRKCAPTGEQLEVLRCAVEMLDAVAELGDVSDLHATVAELLPRARRLFMDFSKVMQRLDRDAIAAVRKVESDR